MGPLTKAADRDPTNPETLTLLARAQYRADLTLPALRTYDRIVQLGAATAETWREMGNGLSDLGEHAQAIGALERSIAARHKNPEAHNNLGRALYEMGEVDRAMKHLALAAEQSDLLEPRISLATIAPGAPGTKPRKILELRQRLAQELRRVNPPRRAQLAEAPRLAAGESIRVGYLSRHFHGENYMKPVWGLINRHDRARFEIHLFSDSPPDQKMEGYEARPEDRVHVARGVSNAKLADLIEKCGIHILVDLGSYSTPERLALFIQRPAPIVVGWFNSFATSGLPGIDYIVGDDEVVVPREEAIFSEAVVRLPLSYLTFEVTHDAPPVVEPPCLRYGFLTFGSLVTQYKITPRVIDCWAKILRKTRGSRLLIANRAMKSRQNRIWLSERFERRGVDPDRLSLMGPAPHLEFLKNYNRIDVALDAFPYNGGTTTMEAIWQGVPVLTFDGDRWASRTSQTLLRRTHLVDWVAPSRRAMVESAVRLARDPRTPERLAELRSGMRDRLESSSACDTPALARAMEEFFLGAMVAQGGVEPPTPPAPTPRPGV